MTNPPIHSHDTSIYTVFANLVPRNTCSGGKGRLNATYPEVRNMSLQDVMDLGKEPASLPALLNEASGCEPRGVGCLRVPFVYPIWMCSWGYHRGLKPFLGELWCLMMVSYQLTGMHIQVWKSHSGT